MRIFNLTNKKSRFIPLQKVPVKDKTRQGFTLIEALVATGILLITAIAFLSTLIQYSTLIATGLSEDIALSAAKQMLEEILSNPTHVGDYDANSFPVDGLTAPAGRVNPGSVAVDPVFGTNDLFDISVTVDWLQGNRPMSRTLRTTLRTTLVAE